MIIEAYMLVTMSIAHDQADVIEYSQPMTRASCVEVKRNVDAMITQSLNYRPITHNGLLTSSRILTRCVPAALVSLNSVETNTTNKIIIRK
jgi:hypothetical protein